MVLKNDFHTWKRILLYFNKFSVPKLEWIINICWEPLSQLRVDSYRFTITYTLFEAQINLHYFFQTMQIVVKLVNYTTLHDISILIIKPTCTISQFYFWNRTLHVSDSFSVHQQESSTVHTAIGICHTGYADCLLGGSGWSR
jgi:hypothetical protein